MARIGASLAPFADALAALARTHAQIVERVLPARLLGEGRMRRDRTEGRGLADRFRARGVERQTGARQRGADHALQIVRVDADALARLLQRIAAGLAAPSRTRS